MLNNISKIILVSFLISLNVCVWKDVLGDIFYEAVFVVSCGILGLFIYSAYFYGKRRL